MIHGCAGWQILRIYSRRVLSSHFRKCPGVSCCPVLQAVVVGCDITMSRGVYGSVMRKSSREALKDSGEIAIYQAKC